MKAEDDVPETGFHELEKEEEVKREKLDFFLKQENWLHFSPELTENGRMTKEELEVADEMEEEAKEAMMKQLEKVVVPVKRLQPISADKCELIRPGSGEVLVESSCRRQVGVHAFDDRSVGLGNDLPFEECGLAGSSHVL